MESKKLRIAMGVGIAVLMVGPPAVFFGVREYDDDADRASIERVARSIIQQRADLASAVGREQSAPEPVGATPAVAKELRGSYAQRAEDARASAAEGKGWSGAEIELSSVEVDLITEDWAEARFDQMTYPEYEDPAVEGSAEDLPMVSSHAFQFRKTDGRWLLAGVDQDL
ncbi:hypothetical protein [Streptomyces jumonjinensis]|uniref:hypothetical protein n=1 Tax=Streptomyces jumonjinensis TaxID=1945 RepID=UPI00378B0754